MGARNSLGPAPFFPHILTRVPFELYIFIFEPFTSARKNYSHVKMGRIGKIQSYNNFRSRVESWNDYIKLFNIKKGDDKNANDSKLRCINIT